MQTFLDDYPDQPRPPELNHLETQIIDLRNQISDLGTETDTLKAKKGGAVGGGVFLLLLALIALYDVVNGKSNLWQSVGISGAMLKLVAVGLIVMALILFSVAIILEKTRDLSHEAKLAELEQELEALLNRKATLESN